VHGIANKEYYSTICVHNKSLTEPMTYGHNHLSNAYCSAVVPKAYKPIKMSPKMQPIGLAELDVKPRKSKEVH
jgi:hypothetical protein